jgi:hypothetical protein
MQASSEPLDFPALLRPLQGWLGCDLCVVVHRPDSQFNIGFCSRLERIRSPSGDGGPAILDFDGARGLTLAPIEGVAHLHKVCGPGGTAEWIEINLAFGMATTIELLPRMRHDQSSS